VSRVVDDRAETWCPSGTATAPESVVLGVRSGQSGTVKYLDSPVPAAEVLGTLPAGIEPTRVLRFASHCVSACLHRNGTDCSLVTKVLALPADPAGGPIPRCHLRAHCKWWAQSGAEACRRCPAVVTTTSADDGLQALVADPTTTRAQLEAWIADAG
jgi:hypothetical protein